MAKKNQTDDIVSIGGNAGARLKSIIDRLIQLENEKKVIGDDVKDVYSEAKAVGFDTKILRKVVKRAQMDAETKDLEDSLIEMYENAICGLEEMME